jgi:hypothetical protein
VSDRLQVVVPHQQQDVVIPLHGNAWPDGVFVAGAEYKSATTSSSSSSSSGTVARPAAAAQAASAAIQDPFAAILVAAAAVAPEAAPAAAAGGAQGVKGKQAAAAAAAAAAASQQQQQEKQGSKLLGSLQPKDVQSVLAAAGYCDLAQGYVTMPGPVGPGQASTAVVEFGSVKSSVGGAAGELVVEELPAEAKEAGWSVDPVKVSVPAGEKRPLTIRFTAPAAAKLIGTALGALGQMQLPVQQTVKLSVVMKGGCQAMAGAPAAVAVAADGTRRMSLVCSCILAPAQAEAAAAATAAVTAAAPGGGTAAAAPAAAKK